MNTRSNRRQGKSLSLYSFDTSYIIELEGSFKLLAFLWGYIDMQQQNLFCRDVTLLLCFTEIYPLEMYLFLVSTFGCWHKYDILYSIYFWELLDRNMVSCVQLGYRSCNINLKCSVVAINHSFVNNRLQLMCKMNQFRDIFWLIKWPQFIYFFHKLIYIRLLVCLTRM